MATKYAVTEEATINVVNRTEQLLNLSHARNVNAKPKTIPTRGFWGWAKRADSAVRSPEMAPTTNGIVGNLSES
jgi:hypothetical protein